MKTLDLTFKLYKGSCKKIVVGPLRGKSRTTKKKASKKARGGVRALVVGQQKKITFFGGGRASLSIWDKYFYSNFFCAKRYR